MRSQAPHKSSRNTSIQGPFRSGVDLVEIRQAKTLYRSAEGRLGTMFSKSEVRYIRSGRRPYERMAALLAAKEAVFKATPGQVTGVASFRGIRVLRNGRIRRRLDDPRAELVLLRGRMFVVARCGPRIAG